MKLMLNSLQLRCIALVTTLGLGAGCTTADPQAINYKSTTRPSESSLIKPPDMIGDGNTLHEARPEKEATLSSYQRQARATNAANDVLVKNVLKPVPGMSIQREGTERWLVVRGKNPQQLWPQLRQFWEEQGFELAVDTPERAIMETNWKEGHAAIKLDFIHNALSKVLHSAYITAERNKYRTRVEEGANGAIYIFISQMGMHEVLTGFNKEFTRWEATPNNPTLETEYLQRLMHTLASDGTKAQKPAVVAKVDAAKNGTSTPLATDQSDAQVLQAESKQPLADVSRFNLEQSFDHAWLRVSLALERCNFTVDDKDRERGLYYLRYVDPNDKSVGQQSFWNQVFHGKKEKMARQYKLNVRALTETVTRVAVLNEAGEVDESAQARQIVSRLAEQLR